MTDNTLVAVTVLCFRSGFSSEQKGPTVAVWLWNRVVLPEVMTVVSDSSCLFIWNKHGQRQCLFWLCLSIYPCSCERFIFRNSTGNYLHIRHTWTTWWNNQNTVLSGQGQWKKLWLSLHSSLWLWHNHLIKKYQSWFSKVLWVSIAVI